MRRFGLPRRLKGTGVLAAILASACHQAGPDAASLGLEQALRDARASLAVFGMPERPAISPHLAGAAQGQRVALPMPPQSGTPRTQGSRPPATAAALMGQGPQAISAALGEPALRRREGSAEIWLYQAEDCRLDVVFYSEGQALILAHAAARAAGPRRLTEAACLAAIATAPHPPLWTAPAAAPRRT